MRTSYFLLFFAIFISCKPEDITISDSGSKTVINGLITSDSLISLNIHTSLKIDDTTLIWTSDKSYNNAKTLIYENDKVIDSMKYHKIWSSNYIFNKNYHSDKIRPMPGHTYKISVKNNGMPDAFALTNIPNLVNIESLDTAVNILSGTFEEWQSNVRLICNISFSDPVNEKNYYLFYVYKRSDNNTAGEMEFACYDPIIEEKLNHGTLMLGYAFSDKIINGKKHRLTLILDGKNIGLPYYGINDPIFTTHKTTLYFRLYSITEEYYKYIHTLNLFFKNYNNPLGVSTQVYSNVTGGYGIFAGAAVSSDSIVFKY